MTPEDENALLREQNAALANSLDWALDVIEDYATHETDSVGFLLARARLEPILPLRQLRTGVTEGQKR